MSAKPNFPNYLEAGSGSEADSRVQAFIPLEFVFEQLKADSDILNSIPTSRMEGAGADIGTQDLYGMLSELADYKEWVFHLYADGESGFVAEVGNGYLSIHLKEGFLDLTKKSDRYQEVPDWLIRINAGNSDTKVEVLRYDTKNYVPLNFAGSAYTLPKVPRDWDPFWTSQETKE